MNQARYKTSRCTRRGTAEIELILSVLVFVSILMLLQGAMKLGVARLATGQTAVFEAFHNATEESVPRYTDEPAPAPVEGYVNIRAGLPNRVHVPRPRQPVTIFTGDEQSTMKMEMEGAAALGAPFWIYTAYPVGDPDRAATQRWFEEFAEDSHTRYANWLGLAPAWAP